MLDIALIPLLTPDTATLLIAANVLGFATIAGGIVWFWHGRIPKISIEEAQRIALNYVKHIPETKSAAIDHARQSQLAGKNYVIPVAQNHGYGVASLWISVDARNGKVLTSS